MTSMLVKGAQNALFDVGSLLNHVEKQEPTTGFGDIMQRAASRTFENQNTPKRDNLIQTGSTRTERPRDTSANSAPNNSGAEANKAEAQNELKTTDQQGIDGQINEKLEEVVKTANEVLNTIAEKFEITPEEVVEVLAILGLIPESLLDFKTLSEVIVVLEGTDLLTLMTDEVLYESFTDLTNEVQPLIGELLEKTDLTPEEMKKLIEQLKVMEEPEVNPDTLTKSVNQTNAITEQQIMEPEQKITIVIERDGVITEVTAKADANGNIKTTDDVVEINTESVVAVETQTESKQSGNQSSERSFDNHEAILNDLLQNRVSTVEAKFEPIILETPNTAEIINQILSFMKIKLTPEVNTLEMQLHPASLGTVGVKIASNAGVITAQFTAQNETVRAAIESQIVELKENMRLQGIKVEAIEVNVESQAFDSKLWQGKDENQTGEQGSKKNRRRINLSGLDELPEDLTGDEKLTAEMMIENGQTVDFSV